MYDSKSLKIFRKWSFSDNFTIETDNGAQISLKKTRSVANISSEYTSLVVSERSLEFLTLFLIVHTHLTLKLTFF